MLREIQVQYQVIRYNLQRKAVRNINLRIRPDQTVTVSANRRVPLAVIDNFVRSKAQLILKAFDRCEQSCRLSGPLQYSTGEVIPVLGHELQLLIQKGERNTAERQGDRLVLTVKDPDSTAQKKKLAEEWLRALCRETVDRLCHEIYPPFETHGIPFPEIRYRRMISRWGSCQPARGVLTFNYALAEVPLPCVEYVVAHEFTHFLQPDHSKAFYQQLALVMPDWKARKEILKHAVILQE